MKQQVKVNIAPGLDDTSSKKIKLFEPILLAFLAFADDSIENRDAPDFKKLLEDACYQKNAPRMAAPEAFDSEKTYSAILDTLIKYLAMLYTDQAKLENLEELKVELSFYKSNQQTLSVKLTIKHPNIDIEEKTYDIQNLLLKNKVLIRLLPPVNSSSEITKNPNNEKGEADIRKKPAASTKRPPQTEKTNQPATEHANSYFLVAGLCMLFFLPTTPAAISTLLFLTVSKIDEKINSRNLEKNPNLTTRFFNQAKDYKDHASQLLTSDFSQT